MKHDILQGLGLAITNAICVYITKVEINDVLSVGAFCVILISNWNRFILQLKKWFKSDKAKKKVD